MAVESLVAARRRRSLDGVVDALIRVKASDRDEVWRLRAESALLMYGTGCVSAKVFLLASAEVLLRCDEVEAMSRTCDAHGHMLLFSDRESGGLYCAICEQRMIPV